MTHKAASLVVKTGTANVAASGTGCVTGEMTVASTAAGNVLATFGGTVSLSLMTMS